jgi:hypothetical protein
MGKKMEKIWSDVQIQFQTFSPFTMLSAETNIPVPCEAGWSRDVFRPLLTADTSLL